MELISRGGAAPARGQGGWLGAGTELHPPALPRGWGGLGGGGCCRHPPLARSRRGAAGAAGDVVGDAVGVGGDGDALAGGPLCGERGSEGARGGGDGIRGGQQGGAAPTGDVVDAALHHGQEGDLQPQQARLGPEVALLGGVRPPALPAEPALPQLPRQLEAPAGARRGGGAVTPLPAPSWFVPAPPAPPPRPPPVPAAALAAAHGVHGFAQLVLQPPQELAHRAPQLRPRQPLPVGGEGMDTHTWGSDPRCHPLPPAAPLARPPLTARAPSCARGC